MNGEAFSSPAPSPLPGSHGSPSLLAGSRLASEPDDQRRSWANTEEKLGERGEMSPAEDARGPR